MSWHVSWVLTAYRAADRTQSCSEWRASAKSLGTGLAGHFLCKLKGKQGRNGCFPGRDACFLAENREELIFTQQDLISLYYLPCPYKSLLSKPGEQHRLYHSSLCQFSLLCHFSEEQGTGFTLTPPFSCVLCCCYFSAFQLFPSKQPSPKSAGFPEGH